MCRWAEITRPDGQTVVFGYDSAGRLQTLTSPVGVRDVHLRGWHAGATASNSTQHELPRRRPAITSRG
ncbi:MAG: RHS repeat protein [Armatimonadetes bacterium]|nr:RHS repeat protein [Armatimonadota bacterium]